MTIDNRIENYDNVAPEIASVPVHLLISEENTSLINQVTRHIPTVKINDLKIPIKYKKDIEKAVQILKNGGCEGVFLYGSVIKGIIHERLGIDLGIIGLPNEKFLNLFTRIYMDVDTEMNVKDFNDFKEDFLNLIKSKGIVKIG